MKNIYKAFFCLAVFSMLLMFGGCKKEKEEPAPTPVPAPAPLPEPEPVVEEVVEEPQPEPAKDVEITSVKSATGSDVSDDVDAPEGPQFLSDIDCDPEGTLSFALTNPTEIEYIIGRVRAMEASEVTPLRVSINGRTIELMDACGTENRNLAPGEAVDCTIEFDPEDRNSYYKVRLGTDTLGDPEANVLNLKTSDASMQWHFKCQ